MNLRTHRSAEKNEPKSDPKAPHVFQEAVEGIGICLVCTHGKSDPRHIAAGDSGSGRWGF
jgi:hypothetical protein